MILNGIYSWRYSSGRPGIVELLFIAIISWLTMIRSGSPIKVSIHVLNKHVQKWLSLFSWHNVKKVS